MDSLWTSGSSCRMTVQHGAPYMISRTIRCRNTVRFPLPSHHRKPGMSAFVPTACVLSPATTTVITSKSVRWRSILSPNLRKLSPRIKILISPERPLPSVSYTHLDVYKRQPPPLPSIFLPAGWMSSPPAITSSAAAISTTCWMKTRFLSALPTIPVSYTHLDVYKRQV